MYYFCHCGRELKGGGGGVPTFANVAEKEGGVSTFAIVVQKEWGIPTFAIVVEKDGVYLLLPL